MKVLFNPALSSEKQKVIREVLLSQVFDEPHVWIATSGTFALEGVSKWAALSERAIFASARAVNRHLEVTTDDIWLNPLPKFHVGGLGITTRSQISGAQEFDFLSMSPKWCPDRFVENLVTTKASLTALVPTQAFDIVVKKHRAPPRLRAVVVGGGSLDEVLYKKARALGWNLLPSYGMTENASQIATSALKNEEEGFPELQVLDHCEVSTNAEGTLQIKGESLFSLYGVIEGTNVRFYDPKVNGLFTTSDRGEVRGRALSIFGRVDDVVKILGENVDIAKLQKHVDSLKIELGLQGDFYLIPRPDERSGNAICLFYTAVSDEQRDQLMSCFNRMVFPFERITRFEKRVELPKTALGKLERKKIMFK